MQTAKSGMMARDIQTIERELKSARTAFSMSRAVLASKLIHFDAREGAQDRLVYLADAYGVDHALETLATNPAALEFSKAGDPQVVSEFREPLAKAYEECHRVDLLMAERENLLREKDPTRPKGLILDNREMEYDGKTARFRDTGEQVEIPHEVVATSESAMDDDNEDEHER